MLQVWMSAMPYFSSMGSGEPMLGPTTVGAVDAAITPRLEDV